MVGSNQTTNTFMNSALLDDIQNNVRSMLTLDQMAFSKSTGTFSITDRPDVLNRIQQYLDAENAKITKQILINVSVVSVTLTDRSQYGVDWSLVYKSVSGNWGFGLTNTVAGIDSSAINGSISILDTSSSPWAGSKSIIQALSQQGRVSSYQSPSVTTLNLQTAPIQIGNVKGYAEGTRADLRRAPSIIGIGEMRDFETFQAGVLAGQLGHFNLTTMHIHSPGEAIARCLTMVPAEMREATARDLLGVLQYIVVQTLLRTVDGQRVAVREYIIFDDPLRGKLSDMPYTQWGHHIDTLIRVEGRRIADQAWRLYQLGRIERSELKSAMTTHQQNEFERGMKA